MELANKLKCVNKINTNKMITLQSDASSNCMKLFNLIGNLESDYKNITKYFLNALMEDKATCIKTIFYARDKWGATTTFRYCLNLLGHLSPDLAGTIFDAVCKYGDYYDLYSFINTAAEKDLLSYYVDGIKKNKEITAFLPSIMSKFASFAKKLTEKLSMPLDQYEALINKKHITKAIEQDSKPIKQNIDVKDNRFYNVGANGLKTIEILETILFHRKSSEIPPSIVLMGDLDASMNYIIADTEADANAIMTAIMSKFDEVGEKCPKVIYWDINAQNSNTLMDTKVNNLQLFSGTDGQIKSILKGELDAISLFESSIEKYSI